MILCNTFCKQKTLFPWWSAVAAEGGQRICWKIQNGEYNHVVIVIESQYGESDFYDLGWES